MIEAKSMYLCGEIILAKDIQSYDQPKKLGLICPFCSEALFINGGGIRSRSGKIQLINPFFSHYKVGTDKFDCEKRARTKAGKERINQLRSEARDQRLKLYNAYLWQIIAEDRNIPNRSLGKVASRLGRKLLENYAIELHQRWYKYQADCYTLVDAVTQSFKTSSSPIIASIIEKNLTKHELEMLGDVNKQLSYFSTKLDVNLHKSICCEVIDFLSTKSAGFAFHKLVIAAARLIELGEVMKPGAMKEVPETTFVHAIIGLIVGTHWIEKIQERLGG